MFLGNFDLKLKFIHFVLEMGYNSINNGMEL